MMIVMRAGASDEQIAAVIRRIEAEGLTALNLPGGERTAIGIASAIPVEVRETLAAALEVMPGVDHVTHISRPYKIASREFFREDTVFDIGGVTFGTGRIVIMAGPCAVESEAQLRRAAEAVSAAGARGLRGGAFKPRTSPYSFQGLGKQGLELPCRCLHRRHCPPGESRSRPVPNRKDDGNTSPGGSAGATTLACLEL